jgi:hypothetical protein
VGRKYQKQKLERSRRCHSKTHPPNKGTKNRDKGITLAPGNFYMSTENEENKNTEKNRSGLNPVVYIATILISLVFFGTTSPQTQPSVLLIVGFLALLMFLASVSSLILFITGLRSRLPKGVRRGVILLSALLPTLMLMLQSVGQLTVRDVLIMTGLFVIGLFYIHRMRSGVQI